MSEDGSEIDNFSKSTLITLLLGDKLIYFQLFYLFFAAFFGFQIELAILFYLELILVFVAFLLDHKLVLAKEVKIFGSVDSVAVAIFELFLLES